MAAFTGPFSFRLSNGWLYGFCGRYPITCQLGTEKKYLSVEERLGECSEFHNSLYLIQRIFPQVCPVWGAYPPNRWWNADHVPAPFCVNLGRSLNAKVADIQAACTHASTCSAHSVAYSHTPSRPPSTCSCSLTETSLRDGPAG